MMMPKLKIGLLLDGLYVPDWALRMLEKVVKSDTAEIALLIVEKEGSDQNKAKNDLEGVLFRLYKRLDGSINRCDPDAMERKELSSDLKKVQTISIRLKREGDKYSIGEDDAKRIDDFNLDVLIDIGLQINHNGVSNCARYGIWSTHLGDGFEYKGGPPGFWESYDDNPITGSYVQILKDNSEEVIYQSYSHTITSSVRRNLNQAYCKSISFIPRKLEELYNLGEIAIAPERQIASNLLHDRPSNHSPSNLEVLNFFLRRSRRKIKHLARKSLFSEQWGLRYSMSKSPITKFVDFQSTLVPPRKTWWADPHIIHKNGTYFIFIEELKLPRSSNHAHISMIRIDGQGTCDTPIPVLERPYHLSYPGVFAVNGSYYMVPESVNNRTIELYEAVDFPWKWRFKKNIMTDILAVDSTLVFKDKLWWLFTNIKENDGAPINDELFLFYSEDLLSEKWKPHPMNPIISDARYARSAGAIFNRDGIYYRPSQDCSRCYGFRVNINKIVKLDEKCYEEVRIEYIEPKGDATVSRIHSYDHCGDMTIIDTYFSQPRVKFRNRSS